MTRSGLLLSEVILKGALTDAVKIQAAQCYIVRGGVLRRLAFPQDGSVAQLAEQVTLNL